MLTISELISGVRKKAAACSHGAPMDDPRVSSGTIPNLRHSQSQHLHRPADCAPSAPTALRREPRVTRGLSLGEFTSQGWIKAGLNRSSSDA